jgi:2-C-methyl-D-erythritol 2,4-cyclodiphosphate synthase
MNFKIGFGYDVHRLAPDYDLWLGGIKIEHEKGAVGHSDADVLIHAICDALLGALGLRDIGYHFPDTDPAYRGIDSKILLQKVLSRVHQKGFRIGNIDSTVCLEKPKINPHIPSMQKCLADILCIETHQISIKATTKEKLGFVGEEKGIEAYAIVLLNTD